MDSPILAPSAFKHGLSEQQILHAYRNPIRAWELEDGVTMILGPDRTALLLEIGFIDGHEATVIIHAMKARAKFLR